MAKTQARLNRSFDWSAKPADKNDCLISQLHTKDIADASTLLLGLPFDGAVLGRKGAAGGPDAIRAALKNLKAYSYTSGELTKSFHDLGDLDLPNNNISRAHELAESAARAAYHAAGRAAKRCRPIFLGGDHSLTYCCALPLLENFGKRLAVINLDAHLDVRTVRKGEAFNSGTSFSRLIDAGLRNYVVIGARSFQTSPHYVNSAKDAGAQIISAEQLHSESPRKLTRRLLRNLPKRIEAIYLSIDVDVADASVAPAVSAPTPGGLFAHQIFEIIHEVCADERVRACDVMELAPALDPNSDRSARLAASCVAEVMAP